MNSSGRVRMVWMCTQAWFTLLGEQNGRTGCTAPVCGLWFPALNVPLSEKKSLCVNRKMATLHWERSCPSYYFFMLVFYLRWLWNIGELSKTWSSMACSPALWNRNISSATSLCESHHSSHRITMNPRGAHPSSLCSVVGFLFCRCRGFSSSEDVLERGQIEYWILTSAAIKKLNSTFIFFLKSRNLCLEPVNWIRWNIKNVNNFKISGQSSLIHFVLITVPLIMIYAFGTNTGFHWNSGLPLILFQEKKIIGLLKTWPLLPCSSLFQKWWP